MTATRTQSREQPKVSASLPAGSGSENGSGLCHLRVARRTDGDITPPKTSKGCVRSALGAANSNGPSQMSSFRLSYCPREGATLETEREVLASVYRYILDHAKEEGAARAPDDTKQG